MSRPDEAKAFFEDITKKAPFTQMQLKAQLIRAQEENERSSLIRKLVVKEDRGVHIVNQVNLNENTVMVIKSSNMSQGECFAADFVNLKDKTVKSSNEYYLIQEEAMVAGLIHHMGGTDTVIGAVQYMIKGCTAK